MSLAPDVFRQGLAAWVSSPRVQAAWREGEGEEPLDGWGWEWEWREEEVGGGHGMPFASLCLTRTHRVKKEEEEDGEAEALELELENYGKTKGEQEGGGEDGEKDACALPMPPPSATVNVSETEMVVVDWELHIVYNEIYHTPALWLKATRSDGVPLTGEEVARLCGVGVVEGEGEEEGGWTVLSQDEHPILGQPFFFLHPCGTPGRMTRLLIVERRVGEEEEEEEEKKARVGLVYLVKWFGLVAAVLGLRFPPQFVRAMLSCCKCNDVMM